jgi:hypothetical protein
MSTTPPHDGSTPRGREIVAEHIERQRERAARKPNPLLRPQSWRIDTPLAPPHPNPNEAA